MAPIIGDEAGASSVATERDAAIRFLTGSYATEFFERWWDAAALHISAASRGDNSTEPFDGLLSLADMDELVVQRDRWHAQFKSTQVASDTALDPRTRMDPKTTTQAARQEEGRAIAQLGRQYSVHQRKLHKLNDQVIAKTREIMDLEERYNVKGQQQVSEAMKAAVRDDNPEHVLRLLGKPAATRTDAATGGAGLMRSST